MSEENVELYRRGIDAYNRGDVEGLIAILDPAVEWAARLSGVEGGVNGHDGVRSWWSDEREAFEPAYIELHEVVDGEDRVVASGTSRMRGGESGVTLDVPFAHATQWRNGKCIRLASFHTLHEALEAAGLRE